MSTLLRDQRLRRDLTATEVARHLAVHPMSVLRWERRERLPGPGHLSELATVLSLETSTVARFFDEVRLPPAGAPTSVRGAGLRLVRRGAGVPVTTVASTLGVLPSTVYNWESGRVRIPDEHLPPLARLVGLAPEVLRARLDGAPVRPEPEPVAPLRRFRRRTGLSQQQVADRIGSTRRRLGAWERGTAPPLWAVRRLAGVYGVPVSRLANATGVTAPPLLDVTRWRAGDLPEVLVAIRSWSGLTQREVADRGGWHPTTVRSWESGRAVPAVRSREHLERMYGLAPDALLAAYPSVRDDGTRSTPAPPASAR